MTETQNPQTDTSIYRPWMANASERVTALLMLAQAHADDYGLTRWEYEFIATATVNRVDVTRALSVFRTISEDLESATGFDTRGGDAVVEVYGRWSDADYLTADEKATELRDELRASATVNAEMLLTLNDNLSR